MVDFRKSDDGWKRFFETGTCAYLGADANGDASKSVAEAQRWASRLLDQLGVSYDVHKMEILAKALCNAAERQFSCGDCAKTFEDANDLHHLDGSLYCWACVHKRLERLQIWVEFPEWQWDRELSLATLFCPHGYKADTPLEKGMWVAIDFGQLRSGVARVHTVSDTSIVFEQVGPWLERSFEDELGSVILPIHFENNRRPGQLGY